jgi:hypothetical protein
MPQLTRWRLRLQEFDFRVEFIPGRLNEVSDGLSRLQVDDDDVPEELRSTSAPPVEDHDVDENHHKRWDWVMGEMIFAFESKLDDDWEKKFESGEADLQWKKLDDGMSQMIHGPNHTRTYDEEGRKKYHDRIKNGFRLFGKYYEGLWD